MGMTMEDILHEQMWEEAHGEQVMKRAALEQCIYVFVEGDSEECTFQTLLEDEQCQLKFEETGVVIANYNGIGNLRHALRLLNKTLSHNRPVIVTYDDDLAGKGIEKHLIGKHITPFRIPQFPVVTFKDGQTGGSFEEAFNAECFIESCFEPSVLPVGFIGSMQNFESIFDCKKPWYAQFAQYVDGNGGNAKSINKVALAEELAVSCNPVPNTFVSLAKTIKEIRSNNPVLSPNDVDMPF